MMSPRWLFSEADLVVAPRGLARGLSLQEEEQEEEEEDAEAPNRVAP